MFLITTADASELAAIMHLTWQNILESGFVCIYEILTAQECLICLLAG